MEATIRKVDRLVDGISGEDPTGTRLYMARLREHEVGLSVGVISNDWKACEQYLTPFVVPCRVDCPVFRQFGTLLVYCRALLHSGPVGARFVVRMALRVVRLNVGTLLYDTRTELDVSTSLDAPISWTHRSRCGYNECTQTFHLLPHTAAVV